MQPALHHLRRVLSLALALGVTSGLAFAADKKDEKKAEEKQKPEAKKAVDPKSADKDAKPATNAIPLVVPFPKAAFNTSVETGKDPFFPSSKRRLPKAPEPPKPPKPSIVPTVVTNNQVVVATTNLPPAATITNPPSAIVKVHLIGAANLSLRGISTSKTRRHAEVHTGVKGYTFLKGETMLIRLPNEKELKVQCLEIRERSAIFQAEGETQTIELFLREGL